MVRKFIKKTTAVLLCAAVAAGLMGCGSVTSGKRIIRVSHAQSETHPEHIGLLAFKEYVEERLGDRYEVQIFPDVYKRQSQDAANPAKFYMVSAPAHTSFTTTYIPIEKAAKRPCGASETANKRVINQFIHPDVLQTCQLSMGMTVLEEGSVWNTMPAHTHERRMEIYMYFEVPGDNVVFHMMGEPTETRHIIMKNEEAVISPSWSIHSGAGTSNYTFIWAIDVYKRQRMIWGETGRAGYGLYDRALGATYLNGLFEAVEKMSR